MEKKMNVLIGGSHPVTTEITTDQDVRKIAASAMKEWKKQGGRVSSEAASFTVVQIQFLVAVKNAQGEIIDSFWMIAK